MLRPSISDRQAMRPPGTLICGFLFCLLAVSAIFNEAEARIATIEQIMVANSSSHVLLYARLTNAFTPEMETALHNGMPVTFTFLIELHRSANPWPARSVASLAFDHTLSYDNLKEEYRLELEERDGRVVAIGSLGEAREMMAEINGLRVAPLANLDPGEDYLLRVKVKLARRTLPLNVHAVIPFWGLRDLKTQWHTVEFRY